MFVGWAVVRRREFAEIAKRIAETLKWLIDAAYVGRKIMLWAPNAHVINARYGPGFGSVSPEPLKDGMMPSGVWFSDSYGDSLYKIGFTAYQGSDGWVGAPSAPVAPAPPSSLEARLHRLCAPEVFLPARGASRLRSLFAAPISLRIPKYKVETVANPS
jgi:erythromycin esterase-like protein